MQTEELIEIQEKIKIDENTPFVLIMVYGTLLKGFGNHRLLENEFSELLGTTQTEPIFTLYGIRAGFPIVEKNGQTAITGEVYRITSDIVLQRLNNLEGSDGIPNSKKGWYKLTPITTEFGDTFIYTMEKGTSGRQESSICYTGNWKLQK